MGSPAVFGGPRTSAAGVSMFTDSDRRVRFDALIGSSWASEMGEAGFAFSSASWRSMMAFISSRRSLKRELTNSLRSRGPAGSPVLRMKSSRAVWKSAAVA
jgi:hypothetical protein